jgi:hypothetical protein
VTTQQLPFPVPDQRARYFVSEYADMHQLVEDLVVPDGVPESAATVLHSLIAVESVLRDRIPDAGKKPLQKVIEQGAASGLLTARQAEFLDDGRKIRNRMAHGQSTHMVMPPAMAAGMVRTSFTIVTELC